MRIFLAGQKYFGAMVYESVTALGHEIVGVSSPAYRDPRIRLFVGDERFERPDRLRAVAIANGTPWMEAGNLRAETLPADVDLIIAAHSYDFIGKATRQKAKLGAIGYHPSLLPLHRGRDAVRWVIKMGERVTGGSVFWLNDGVDAGAIAAQDYCFVRPDDTPDALWRRELQPLGVRLFEKALKDLQRGVVVAVGQDEALATWEPSWERAPLYRPDLLQIGAPPEGFRVVRQRKYAAVSAAEA